MFLCVAPSPHKVRNMLLIGNLQTHPSLASLPVCWTLSLMSSIAMGAAEFGLQPWSSRESSGASRILCLVPGFERIFSTWCTLQNVSQHPILSSCSVLVSSQREKIETLPWQQSREGILSSRERGCYLCKCSASSFLSTYLQLPGIQ